MAEGPKNFRTQRQLRNINSQIKSVQMQANLLPINLFEERNEVDRFDFSAAVAERFCLKKAPRSHACYMQRWIWWRDLRLKDLGYFFIPRNTPIVVARMDQKEVLVKSGFSNVGIGGLPLSM